MKWVEQVASHPGDKGKGLIACAVGKTVHLFDAAGQKLKELPHPSTVTGLAFDAQGQADRRVALQRRQLWFVAAKTDSPRVLEWKGSHTGIAHPSRGRGGGDGDAGERAARLAAARRPAHAHERLSRARPQSLSFTRNGKWLATSGADAMVLWPFFGGGPMGKAPMELAGGDGILCTQVACHPQQEMVAGGFADGLVVLADIELLAHSADRAAGHGPVSALAWSPDGTQLAIGTEQGLRGDRRSVEALD